MEGRSHRVTPPLRRALERAPGSAASAGRVLLAEDDAEMRRVLAHALRGQRFDVVEAGDGQELLEQLAASIVQQLPVDCIITDVCMPGITGMQALRHVRASGADCPVIVITAFADNRARVEAWLLGGAAVIDKPFSLPQLLDELRRIGLGGSRSRPHG